MRSQGTTTQLYVATAGEATAGGEAVKATETPTETKPADGEEKKKDPRQKVVEASPVQDKGCGWTNPLQPQGVPAPSFPQPPPLFPEGVFPASPPCPN